MLRETLTDALGASIASEQSGALLFLILRMVQVGERFDGTCHGRFVVAPGRRSTAGAGAAGGTVARFGGDEFVILLPVMVREDVRTYALQLLDSLRDPCHLQELRYVTQASLGVVMFPADGDNVDELLKNADIAMYRAKAGGRARMCFFDTAMSDEVSDRLKLEEHLRAAIYNGEIRAIYQPKVDADGSVIAAEALARWLAHDGTLIAPANFIALAEETGLIVPLGELMLRESCQQLAAWRARGICIKHVAVNVSLVQMRDPGFPQFVQRCLNEHNLSGDSLRTGN